MDVTVGVELLTLIAAELVVVAPFTATTAAVAQIFPNVISEATNVLPTNLYM